MREEVHVVSFPKTGRTWLRLMIGRAIVMQLGLSDSPDETLDLTRLTVGRPELPIIRVSHDNDPHRTHYREVPVAKTAFKDSSVTLLVRDPRDVLVSWYYHNRNREDAKLQIAPGADINDFCLSEVGGIRSLVAFYNNWADHADLPRRLLIIRYEDLLEDAYAQLAHFFETMGIAGIGVEALREAVDFCRFNNMQRMERQGNFQSDALKKPETASLNALKVRSGVVGSYLSELSPSCVAELNSHIRRLHPMYGYTDIC